VTLQMYISSWADHAQWTLRTFQLEGEVAPVLPPVSKADEARASLFASDDVVDIMKAFSREIMAYRIEVGHVEQLLAMHSTEAGPRLDLDVALAKRAETARTLVAQAEAVPQKLRDELRNGERRRKFAGIRRRVRRV